MRGRRTTMRFGDIVRGSLSVVAALAIFFFVLALVVFLVKVLAG